jgi:6-phosphogluconolactonase/glucosamine-6-phosphate isomerase/deaminase
MIEIRVFQNREAWCHDMARDFVEALSDIPESRLPRLCLAGGRTPEPVYRALSQLMVEGRAGQAPAILVPGDERVPGDELWSGVEWTTGNEPSPTGNERGPTGYLLDLNETMLHQAFAPALASGRALLYSWFDFRYSPGADLAQSMIKTMETRLALLARPGEALFDLCYLGMGADGHTAGLFPGMPGLDEPGICIRGLAPTPPRQRVSLSFPSLLSSRRTRFIISSPGKEAALDRLRAGDPACPAVRAATADTIAFVLA